MTLDETTTERIANVLRLASPDTPERPVHWALCRCERETGRCIPLKYTDALTRQDAERQFGEHSPEMFVASVASLAVTGLMPRRV